MQIRGLPPRNTEIRSFPHKIARIRGFLRGNAGVRGFPGRNIEFWVVVHVPAGFVRTG